MGGPKLNSDMTVLCMEGLPSEREGEEGINKFITELIDPSLN